MKRIILVLSFLVLLTTLGCSSYFGKVKIPDLPGTEAHTPSEQQSYIDDLNRVAEEAKKAETKANLKYDKVKQQLSKAYEDRQKIDYDSFDTISQVNYGIYFLSKDFGTNKDLYLIHLRSEQNLYRLNPLDVQTKTFIESEITTERTFELDQLKNKYEKLFEESKDTYSKWEKADNLVKSLIIEKEKVRKENETLLRKIEMDKVKAVAEIEASLKVAEAKAKDEQLKEIRGWMAKVFAGVAVIAIIAGILMKSVTFIIPGLICGGMALAVTVIPMWTVFVFLGVAMVGMLLLDPKKGKFSFGSEKKEP